jgi:hypothetical protein
MNIYKYVENQIRKESSALFETLAGFIGVNTFCIAKTSASSTLIQSVYNRKNKLFQEDDVLPLEDAY